MQNSGYSVSILDKFFLDFTSKPKAGWLYINSSKLPRYKFLLTIGSTKSHYIPITIIPGETTYFVLQNIAKKLKLNKSKLLFAYSKLAYFKEGNFISNTYNIPIYFKERDVIDFCKKCSKRVKKIFKI